MGKVKNIEASVRAKLLNYAKNNNENYNTVLTRFFQERYLARLSRSKYKKNFILKGGFLLLTESIGTFRPTVDIDMLGANLENNDATYMETVIKQIAAIEYDDAVRYDTDNVIIQILKEDADYEGLRFIFWAHLGKIKSRMQIDIAFGDAVPAGFSKKSMRVMLNDFDAPQVLMYPLESVIAEKFQAIVYLGEANSRMKDFYDILFLAKNTRFTMSNLNKAIYATFQKRDTNIENRFFIYQDAYIKLKSGLWLIFLRKIKSADKAEFSEAVSKIKDFIEPVITLKDMSFKWNRDQWKWLNK